MKLVSVTEMKAIEQKAAGGGLSYETMMKNAGFGLAQMIDRYYGHLLPKTALGLIGSGNNGGDTLIALDHLLEMGWEIRAWIIRQRHADDPLLLSLKQKGVLIIPPDQDFLPGLKGASVIVDGVLGTGVRLPLDPEIGSRLSSVKNSILKNPQKIFVVAADCPSGVDCSTGEAAVECIPADLTVCMASAKTGMLSFPAFELLGQLVKVDIGLPIPFPALDDIPLAVADEESMASLLPARPANSHKGSLGTITIAAGSINYPGAALLAGKGAYMVGTGLVQMAVPESIQTIIAGNLPEAIWLLLPERSGVIDGIAAKVVKGHLSKSTAMLIGPGLGQEKITLDFIDTLLTAGPEEKSQSTGFLGMDEMGKRPDFILPSLVVDADGLRLVSRIKNWTNHLPPMTILTPHPGEMAALTGLSVSEIQADRIKVATSFAREWGHIVVLKGALTIIAQPDGAAVIIPVSTSALAKAGTGDVLAGMIAGLLSQKIAPYSAAVLGAYLHAQAGLIAQDRVGVPESVMASDVITAIPKAIYKLRNLTRNSCMDG